MLTFSIYSIQKVIYYFFIQQILASVFYTNLKRRLIRVRFYRSVDTNASGVVLIAVYLLNIS